MLLLLLIGAGITTPTTDGVRAYANTTYRAVSNAATAATSITNADGSMYAVTNADTTEE